MMRRFHRLLPVTTLAMALVSGLACSSISVSGGNPEEPTGFKYYETKPFLVIEHGKEGTEVRLVSLPDVRKPRYISYEQRLIGSIEFGLKLQDGMLIEFNSKSDSQIDELATGVAALGNADAAILSAEAAMISALAALSSPSTDPAIAATGKESRVVLVIDQAITSLTALSSDLGTHTKEEWEESLRDAVQDAIRAFSPFRRIEYDPEKPKEISEKLIFVKAALTPQLPALLEKRDALGAAMSAAQSQSAQKALDRAKYLQRFSEALVAVQSFVAPPSRPELYEILPPLHGDPNGALRFRRVVLGA